MPTFQRAHAEQDYDSGPNGRFGNQERSLPMLLVLPNGFGPLRFRLTFGLDPHNSYLNAFGSNGWFPGGGAFFSYSLAPDIKVGFATTGNFGLSEQYDDGWVGRYYVQEATLVGLSFLPSIAAKVTDQFSVGASLNAMYGKYKNQVAINIPNALRPAKRGSLRQARTNTSCVRSSASPAPTTRPACGARSRRRSRCAIARR